MAADRGRMYFPPSGPWKHSIGGHQDFFFSAMTPARDRTSWGRGQHPLPEEAIPPQRKWSERIKETGSLTCRRLLIYPAYYNIEINSIPMPPACTLLPADSPWRRLPHIRPEPMFFRPACPSRCESTSFRQENCIAITTRRSRTGNGSTGASARCTIIGIRRHTQHHPWADAADPNITYNEADPGAGA